MGCRSDCIFGNRHFHIAARAHSVLQIIKCIHLHISKTKAKSRSAESIKICINHRTHHYYFILYYYCWYFFFSPVAPLFCFNTVWSTQYQYPISHARGPSSSSQLYYSFSFWFGTLKNDIDNGEIACSNIIWEMAVLCCCFEDLFICIIKISRLFTLVYGNFLQLHIIWTLRLSFSVFLLLLLSHHDDQITIAQREQLYAVCWTVFDCIVMLQQRLLSIAFWICGNE